MSLRELFRHKLENTEVIPGAAVNSKLMRRLARREFLRFNPTRFNIYYLGGIAAAAILTAIILSSGNNSSNHSTTSYMPSEPARDNKSKDLNIAADQTGIPKPAKINRNVFKLLKNTPASIPSFSSEKETISIDQPRQIISIKHTGIHDSLLKSGFYDQGSDGKNVLKGNFKRNEDLFASSATKGCIPLKLRFSIKSDSYDSCRWTFGDGGYSSEANPEWIYDVEGDYKVVLFLYGKNGLKATSSSLISVHPKPQARFEISPENASIPDDEIRFLNYSVNAVHFNWDFGDGTISELFEPRHIYSKFSNYNVRLVVTSDFGCTDSVTVMNAFSDSEYFIEFPNAFIPNPQGPVGGAYSNKSDETALVFHPVYSGVTDYQLRIFSKMGILIFESSDISIGWDGYFKGQLSNPGVYIWKVRGNFRNGEPFIRMGDVTLLKN
jgi:PKD repeat protein